MMNEKYITKEDLTERFSTLVGKAQSGKCIIPGCEQSSELMTHARDQPPILCRHHQDQGNVTHYGDYLQTENPYYKKWTCCESTWFNSKCSRLTRQFSEIASIPVSEQQLKNLEDEIARLTRQQEEQERWERMINAGREESYDR